MRTNGVEAAIAHYREAGTKKYAHNPNCPQRGSAYLGVLLYPICEIESPLNETIIPANETDFKNMNSEIT